MLNQILEKNIYIIITMFLSGCFVLILSNNLYKSNIYEIVSNGFYSNDMSHFTQLDDVDMEDLILISDNTIISKELSDIMRGIYFTPKYNYQLPTIEGRFFTYTDFQKDNNYVVVGKALQDYIYTKDNKKYYSLNNIEYEVIGILGIDTDSKLDYFIFFNLLNVYEHAPQKTKISFGKKSENTLNKINDLNLSDYFTEIKISSTGISRIWGSSNIYIMVTICIYVCLTFTVLLLILLKSSYYTNYIRVCHILGFKKKFIYKNILVVEWILYALAFFIGELSFLILSYKNYYLNSILFSIMLKLFFISCSIYILFSLILFKFQCKKILCAGG